MIEFKNALKHRVLRAAGVRRIHIVGCARSGTTMLRTAMIAFKGTDVRVGETSVWRRPGLSESLSLFAKNVLRRDPAYYVTKRGWGWWEEANIDRLARFAVDYNILLMHVVRDPRDVLTSKHPKNRRRYYVEPDHWRNSVEAGERFLALLRDYPHTVTLRYEDVARDGDATQRVLMDRFGLELREGVTSWTKVATNAKLATDWAKKIPERNLRDFDARSIGRWRSEPDSQAYIPSLLNDSRYGKTLQGFMEKYGYLD